MKKENNFDYDKIIKKFNEIYNINFNEPDCVIKNFKDRKGLNNKLKKYDLFNKRGVYIITNNSQIVYIGSSGKKYRDGKVLRETKNENGIGGRLFRSYTPYSFVKDVDSLCYNWKKNSTSKKSENYGLKKIHYDNIEINIFHESKFLPSVLEHMLLQSCYSLTQNLPLINNQI